MIITIILLIVIIKSQNAFMIICICNDINDRDIRQLVRQGLVGCVDSVRETTGAGNCCGACTCKVESLLQQEQSLNTPHSLAQTAR